MIKDGEGQTVSRPANIVPALPMHLSAIADGEGRAPVEGQAFEVVRQKEKHVRKRKPLKPSKEAVGNIPTFYLPSATNILLV